LIFADRLNGSFLSGCSDGAQLYENGRNDAKCSYPGIYGRVLTTDKIVIGNLIGNEIDNFKLKMKNAIRASADVGAWIMRLK